MTQMVNADIRHQKHQARITSHCKYVKNKDNREPAAIENLNTKSKKINGPTPITRKLEISEMTI